MGDVSLPSYLPPTLSHPQFWEFHHFGSCRGVGGGGILVLGNYGTPPACSPPLQ
eukprot:NODE_112_length_1386_cov_50.934929_g90_i0.p7 GENE.NODE_112_length_1386_cov_50.934929_g90_i0~~NODE_112_length_1386_cov_50.934929_g90_i0.p7  ORF type:complete len:54 (+),score=0.81 NODE_112_length_1386_cov_50.934929_g90_i0:643-804(+)